MAPRHLLPGMLLALAFEGALAPAAAQAGGDPACALGTIDHIFIDNHSIFDTSDPELDPRFRWAYRLANRLHVRTRPAVIARELLFEVGDCFDATLLDESGRLLRARPYIARVDIYGIQQPGGGYHVVVDTEDEWSTQVEVRVDFARGLGVEGLDLRERNLVGTGHEVGFFYRSLDATLEYGLRAASPQLAGTRWETSLAAGRTRAGNVLTQTLTHPFVGEIGRWSFRQGLHHRDRLFDYVAPATDERDEVRVLLPLTERSAQGIGMRRFGPPGNITVLGAGLSFLELAYPGENGEGITVVEAGDFDDRRPAPPELRGPAEARMAAMNTLRLIGLIGKRNVTWEQREGLDSFRGRTDVRLGTEIELAVGRSLPGLRVDDDMSASLDIYAAVGPPAAFLALRARGDARRDYAAPADESELKDLFGEMEALLYLRPAPLPAHTFVLRAAAAGGWHVETPFQIALGGERALRGWAEDRIPGGRRLVFTAENRWFWGGPMPDVLDLGSSLFVDVGRIWPGEAPFGMDSGWRASIGAGLRANFPAGGTNSLRIDAALPVDGRGFGSPRLLIGVGEYLGLTVPFSDPRFGRSRLQPLTGTALAPSS